MGPKQVIKAELICASELGVSELALWDRYRNASSALASPYYSTHWMSQVARVREDVQIAVLMDSRGMINGFLPMQRPTSRIAVPVGGALNDYHGMIAAPECKVDMCALMNQMNIGRYDFSNAPASQQNFSNYARTNHGSHVIDLSMGLQGYLANRKNNGSTQDKRARKRYRKLERDVGPVRLECFSQDQAGFAQMLRWKRAQYQKTQTPDVFDSKWTFDLVHNLLEAGASSDFGGALFLLYAGDKLMAANYCLMDNDVLHAWFIAHNPNFCVYSPGQILFESMIHELADTKVREIDLGAGNYRFKTSLSNVTRPLHGGYIAGCPMAAMIRESEYRLRNWVEGLPLGRFSQLPGKAMRRMDTYRGLA